MKEKIRKALNRILMSDGDPKKIALACGIGVFVAFFPILGVHTLLALLLAWMFRVSPAITLITTLVNNPWTIAPIYGGSLWLGMMITDTELHDFNINWSEINWPVFVELVKLVGVPFVIGCLVLGAIFGIAGYFAALRAVTVYRQGKAGAGPAAS